MRSMKNSLAFLALTNALFATTSAKPSHGKSNFTAKHAEKLFRYRRTGGSKPTTRRLKVKASRKANVQRLIKNK